MSKHQEEAGAAPAAGSVYLDNAATTYPKPEPVYSAIMRFMREVGGSAGRSGHRRSVEAGRVVYSAREELAGLFGISDPLRLAFTKNATEALNMAIWGLLEPGDHVVTSSMEHNSVIRPLHAAGRFGITHTVVTCDVEGRLDPAALREEIRPDTRLIVLTQASNLTGTILPVADAAEIARASGVTLLVDAAQSAGRLKIDVEADGVDVLAFTGHKELFGPQGTGGLYVREGVELTPICFGGTGSRSSSLEQPELMPDRLESGTLNAPGIAGLGAGARFVGDTGVEAVRSHELELLERLSEGLARLPDVTVLGPDRPSDRVGIVPLTFSRLWPTQAAELLDTRYGIATRPGMHCAPLAHRTIGTIETGALRVSFSYMNTASDIDYLLKCLAEITAG
jgi:cysteine desulfurase family protein